MSMRNVNVYYGDKQAIQDVSVDIAKNEVIAMIGFPPSERAAPLIKSICPPTPENILRPIELTRSEIEFIFSDLGMRHI